MPDFMHDCKKGHPLIMGIVNVTPDSFSDGGLYMGAQNAIDHGVCLIEQGAHILDIGGESTRPNAETVTVEEEIARVIPVIEGLSSKVKYISIDTRNAKTVKAAIKVGANIINDVSGLTHDVDMSDIVAQSGLPVCIMHMQGTPQTMQNAPRYDNVIDEIMAFFEERLEFCQKHGIDIHNVIFDPGIGFGKTLDHNLSILKNIHKFKSFGCPVLLGASRKSFIQDISGKTPADNRIAGSISAALYGLMNDIEIFRVHDVMQTRQAFDVYQAILGAS
ncbi:MAG: dihydropteroate synthase [Alphaproteobacteria bacterium]